MKPVIIFGTGNIAKIALSILQDNNLFVCGLVATEHTSKKNLYDVPILGEVETAELLQKIGKRCLAFVAIEEQEKRKKVLQQIVEKNTLEIINAIHPKAYLPIDITLGQGNLIDRGTNLYPCTRIGNGCIIEGNSLIGPDVTLENFVHIGAGTIIQQNTTIGHNSYIGPKSLLLKNTQISNTSHIKAGSLIDKNM